MPNGKGHLVGIDVSKDRLKVAVVVNEFALQYSMKGRRNSL
jgi:hypothetical protein